MPYENWGLEKHPADRKKEKKLMCELTKLFSRNGEYVLTLSRSTSSYSTKRHKPIPPSPLLSFTPHPLHRYVASLFL